MGQVLVDKLPFRHETRLLANIIMLKNTNRTGAFSNTRMSLPGKEDLGIKFRAINFVDFA